MRTLDEALLNKINTFVQDYQRDYGRSPSYRTVQTELGLSSLSTAHRYIRSLQQQGLLMQEEDGSIAISESLTAASTRVVPLVGVVTCGAPITAIENIEGNYSLPTELFGNDEGFMLRARGDSMINAGIYDGDLLFIRKQSHADNGDIVVAMIDDEATVKRLFVDKKNHCVHLHPENDALSDIVVDNCVILGVVKGNIHLF